MKTIHSIALASVCLICPLLCSAQADDQAPSKSAPAKKERVEQMNPFTVSALYAAIEVEFTLSGKVLFNPLADTVESAEVTVLQLRDPEDTPEISIGDKIVSIDGVELRGRTLSEISKLLSQARDKGVPLWKISGNLGLGTKSIRFDGDWLVPLPGLKR